MFKSEHIESILNFRISGAFQAGESFESLPISGRDFLQKPWWSICLTDSGKACASSNRPALKVECPFFALKICETFHYFWIWNCFFIYCFLFQWGLHFLRSSELWSPMWVIVRSHSENTFHWKENWRSHIQVVIWRFDSSESGSDYQDYVAYNRIQHRPIVVSFEIRSVFGIK